MTELACVLESLQTFYDSNTSREDRIYCDRLLKKFQQSPNALFICLQLLQSPPIFSADTADSNNTARAFAASTIVSITRKYVSQNVLNGHCSLQEELLRRNQICQELMSLSMRIWNILTDATATQQTNAIRNQLSFVIATIMLRYFDLSISQSLQPPLQEYDIIKFIASLAENQERQLNHAESLFSTRHAILQVLREIPEEVDQMDSRTDDRCLLMLQTQSNHIIDYALNWALLNEHETYSFEQEEMLHRALFQCLANWIDIGKPNVHSLLERKVLTCAFDRVLHYSLIKDAFVLIDTIVSLSSEQNCLTSIEKITDHFVQYGTRLLQKDCTQGSAGRDQCLKHFAISISDCGKSFMSVYLESIPPSGPRHRMHELLEIMLAITSSQNLDISNEMMDFWIGFKVFLEGRDQYFEEFDGFIKRLFQILLQRTQYPDNYEQLSPYMSDQFLAYRGHARQLFRSLVMVTNLSEDAFVLDLIYRILELYDHEEQNPHFCLQTEVLVHALSAVSKCIREEDTSIIPRLFKRFSRTKMVHEPLIRMITVFLGCCAPWFARNPHYLHSDAYNIMRKCYQIRRVQTLHSENGDHVGLVALKKLCSRNAKHMLSSQWIEFMLELSFSKHLQVVSRHLRLIVESLCIVLSNASYDEAFAVLEQFFKPDFVELVSAISQRNESLFGRMSSILESIKICASHIPLQIGQDTLHPVLQLLHSQWHVFGAIFDVAALSERLYESFCLMLQVVFDSLRFHAKDLAYAILPRVVNQFSQFHDGISIRVFASILPGVANGESDAHVLEIFVGMTQICLDKMHSYRSIDDASELYVSLLDCSVAIGKYRPVLLVSSEKVEALVHLVLRTIQTSQCSEVIEAALRFLSEMSIRYKDGLYIPQEQMYCLDNQQTLLLHRHVKTVFIEKDLQYHVLVALLHAAAASVSSSLIEKIAEVIRFCWICYGRTVTGKYFSRLLRDKQFLGSRITERTRGEFEAAIQRADCIANSRKFRRVIVTFCAQFRKFEALLPVVS